MVSHCISSPVPKDQNPHHISDRFQRSLFDLFDSPKHRAETTARNPVPGSMRSIDPARWAELCRHLGNLSSKEFKRAEKRLYPDPDSLKSRFKRLFSFDQADCKGVPLVCVGRKKPFSL